MSFYKDYPNRKDRRKQYRFKKDSRSFDSSCKNHKSCSYCCDKRQFFDKKNRYFADKELEDYLKGDIDG